jgi:hypothetical protein
VNRRGLLKKLQVAPLTFLFGSSAKAAEPHINVDRAIEILNQKNHRGVSDWLHYFVDLGNFVNDFVISASNNLPYRCYSLSNEEAIAMAEWYERGSK